MPSAAIIKGTGQWLGRRTRQTNFENSTAMLGIGETARKKPG
jgi:hypothetical protein